MENLSDLYYFHAVAEHGGFSAAARAMGIEKTRLSRRVAALERRVGVSLLHRTTRLVTLTEAGERFRDHCQAVVEGARSAYDSVAKLQREPTETVRITCPPVMAQSYLTPILPAYLATHPKVRLELETTDRSVDLIEERFDLAVRARANIEDSTRLVARPLGRVRWVLVASPVLFAHRPRPQNLQDITKLPTISAPADSRDSLTQWVLQDVNGVQNIVPHVPQLLSGDLRVQLEAAIHGVGIALLPEPVVIHSIRIQVLEVLFSDWAAASHIIHLVYPRPRGMLPSVRSVIDYLSKHLSETIEIHRAD